MPENPILGDQRAALDPAARGDHSYRLDAERSKLPLTRAQPTPAHCPERRGFGS